MSGDTPFEAPLLLRSSAPEKTEEFGRTLAAHRPPRRDALTVVYLTGDLGAGKTTLARGFLHASGIAGAVRSPTFTLLEAYETPAVTIVHLDLYRLRDPSELEPLGLRDLALPGYVWLVEWPEKGEGWLPPPDLLLTLSVSEANHDIAARGFTRYGRSWLRSALSA